MKSGKMHKKQFILLNVNCNSPSFECATASVEAKCYRFREKLRNIDAPVVSSFTQKIIVSVSV